MEGYGKFPRMTLGVIANSLPGSGGWVWFRVYADVEGSNLIAVSPKIFFEIV